MELPGCVRPEGGGVYKWVMRCDRVDFKAAHLLLAALAYGYDRYSNRQVRSTRGRVNNYNPSYDEMTNRIVGLGYDAAGNITSDPSTGGTMSYDAENRMVTATSGGGGSYTYDGEGRRVKRAVGGQEWRYVYGIGGELIAEYVASAPSVVKKEYGYRGGQLLVVWDGEEVGDKQLKWLVKDHLGSVRMEADKSGSLAGMVRHDYLPFGEELYAGLRRKGSGEGQYGYEPPQSNLRQRFDAYERDSETGLDFAQARYFSSIQGRFTSTDPLYIEMKRLPYPQAWNLYAYTRNNPVKYVDPDGLEIKVACADGKLCDETVANLNNRKNAQFKVELKNGKLVVVGKVDASKLNKSERQLYNAITDTKHSAEIQVRTGSDAIDFAQYAKPGFNIIDAADVRQLNKVDQRLSGEVIAHEALEAYAGVAEGKSSFTDAHARANEFFGGAVILTESIQAVPRSANPTFSGQAIYNFRLLGVQVTIQKLFISPQPAESLPDNWERIRGNLRVIPPKSGQEKK